MNPCDDFCKFLYRVRFAAADTKSFKVSPVVFDRYIWAPGIDFIYILNFIRSVDKFLPIVKHGIHIGEMFCKSIQYCLGRPDENPRIPIKLSGFNE